MNVPASNGSSRRLSFRSKRFAITIFLLSLGAVFAALALSVTVEGPEARAAGMCAIIGVFAAVFVTVYSLSQASAAAEAAASVRRLSDDEIEARLAILDEAREFFAGSLRTSDIFRLVVSRLAGLVEFSNARLLLVDPEGDAFVTAASDTSAVGERVAITSGVAGQSYAERDVAVDDLENAAAIPLKREAEIFGVIELNFADGNTAAAADVSVLDAIGERVAPLILASLAFERSHSNALVDRSTALPNERAFHLVLENQVAEAARKRGSRPLTILSFDIQGFDEACARYGHSAGDRLLAFVAQNAKESLRQMDFLAKGVSDEFLAILPAASREVAHEITARIQASIFGKRVKVSDVGAVEVELNFGSASFGEDGDTPAVLLNAARVRREQTVGGSGSVLWFPQTYTN